MSFEREKISYMIGTRIRNLRIQKKLSQEELALAADIHPAYLGRVERGEKCPSIETVYKIAQGLKVSLCELTDFSDESTPIKVQLLKRIENAIADLSDEEASNLVSIIEQMINFKNRK